MTELVPWLIAAVLYFLGGLIVYQDMKEADKQEPWTSERFKWATYFICGGLWPFLVVIILVDMIVSRVKP